MSATIVLLLEEFSAVEVRIISHIIETKRPVAVWLTLEYDSVLDVLRTRFEHSRVRRTLKE